MCKSLSEGGQRCAAHTRPGYEQALAAWDVSRNASDEQTDAVVDFASTPTGSKAIAAEIEASTDPQRAAWLAHALARGKERTSANKDLAKALAKAERSPATAEPAAASTRPTRVTLSPSRLTDFKSCPLAYRYRTIDKFPEPKTAEPVRGTLVHGVLEKMFDRPAADRTPGNAAAMLPGEWDAMLAKNPEFADLMGEDGTEGWLTGARTLLDRYFAMEDPRSANPTKREEKIQYKFSDQVTLLGYIDRLDVNADGDMRVIDYKTGRSPRLGNEDKALFQLRFYALALYKSTGRVPKVLQLMYMGDGQVLRYSPTEADMVKTEAEIGALWKKIDHARKTGEFKARKTPLCAYCSFKDKCPEFGGTVPPMPSL